MLAADVILVSAGTVVEALIVARSRNLYNQVLAILEDPNVSTVNVTAASARRSVDAYARWGKGMNEAKLNFGDCFAYELAMSRACPLLYIGKDFAKTDVKSAL